MGERLREATEHRITDTPDDIVRQFIGILALLAKETEADNLERIVLPWDETVGTLAYLGTEWGPKVYSRLRRRDVEVPAISDELKRLLA